MELMFPKRYLEPWGVIPRDVVASYDMNKLAYRWISKNKRDITLQSLVISVLNDRCMAEFKASSHILTQSQMIAMIPDIVAELAQTHTEDIVDLAKEYDMNKRSKTMAVGSTDNTNA
jgi:hypothetical protein